MHIVRVEILATFNVMVEAVIDEKFIDELTTMVEPVSAEALRVDARRVETFNNDSVNVLA